MGSKTDVVVSVDVPLALLPFRNLVPSHPSLSHAPGTNRTHSRYKQDWKGIDFGRSLTDLELGLQKFLLKLPYIPLERLDGLLEVGVPKQIQHGLES